MLRRLAIIATALALAACSDGFYAPTEVSLQQNIADSVTVPLEYCYGFASPEIRALIPECQE